MFCSGVPANAVALLPRLHMCTMRAICNIWDKTQKQRLLLLMETPIMRPFLQPMFRS